MTEDASRHRAKVYCLNTNGQWDDHGTGHAAVQYSPVRQRRPAASARCWTPRPDWALGSTRADAVALLPSQAEQTAYLVVASEDDANAMLLQARVHMEDIYQRQQGERPAYRGAHDASGRTSERRGALASHAANPAAATTDTTRRGNVPLWYPPRCEHGPTPVDPKSRSPR